LRYQALWDRIGTYTLQATHENALHRHILLILWGYSHEIQKKETFQKTAA